jgi:hypothetical protein
MMSKLNVFPPTLVLGATTIPTQNAFFSYPKVYFGYILGIFLVYFLVYSDRIYLKGYILGNIPRIYLEYTQNMFLKNTLIYLKYT